MDGWMLLTRTLYLLGLRLENTIAFIYMSILSLL